MLMKNKKTLVIVSFFLSIAVFSQKEVVSNISDVTVFKRNAEITRNISYTTTPGTQEVVLTGFSTSIIPSSIQVQLSNTNVVLLSTKYEKNYLQSEKTNVKTQKLKDKLVALNDQLALFDDKKSSLKGIEDILNKNKDLGIGNASFTAQQVIELSNSYETKFLEIRKALRIITKKEAPLKEQLVKITNQLNEANAKFNTPSGSVLLKINATTSKSIIITCKYIVNNVGWNPIYDVRSEGITKNVQLNYKANVYQQTGIDWENVAVVVSTGNPSQNNNRPILNPLYANVYENRATSRMRKMKESEASEMRSMKSNMALKKTSGFINNATVSENQLNIDFNITKKQTIYSDGKENLMALKSYDLKTEYIYHSVPKLNKRAFLLAKISDWSNYNLVAGKANIFFEGGFVGTSYIDPNVTSDSLLISMGVDNAIVIERLPIEQFSSSKFIGTNKKEKIGYEFVIKNKKSIPIKIELLDQIPVSQSQEIEIVLEEKGTATYLKETGKLLWLLDVKARETRKEKFIYTAKYPKKKRTIGIKYTGIFVIG